jgi:hypothetical protein
MKGQNTTKKSQSYAKIVKLTIIFFISICFRSTRIIRSISDLLFELIWYGPDNHCLAKTKLLIISFVEWLDTLSYVLRPEDVTVKEVNHIRCFAIDISKDRIPIRKRRSCPWVNTLCRLCTHWMTLMLMCCILDVYIYKHIGKPNNLKGYGSKKNKRHQRDSQNLQFF